MRSTFLALAVPLFLLTFSLKEVWAKEDPGKVVRFGICPGNLAHVVIAKEGDEGALRLAIALNHLGAEELDSFSAAHIGEVVEIVFDGAVLLRTPIHARISGGKLLSRKWSSIAAAEAMAGLLGNNTLGAPCGPIEE